MARKIEVVIVGDATALEAALGKSSAQVAGFANKMESAGKSMASAGKTMTTHLTLPIVAAGAVAVKFAVDFQHNMELVHTQAGAAQSEVTKMSAAILKLSPDVATGPDELAKALYHIESVGLRGAAALNVLKESALGAKVGNADLESTTNALTAAWVSGIKGASNMRAAMGTLNAIVGVGNMRMGDLAAAMSSGILPRAKTFGISLQSVGSALATMTDAGVPAQQAATRLGMTFSLLGAPTSKAQTLLASIGISSLQMADSMRQPGGLINAIQLLHDHLTGLTKSQQAALLSGAFGGGRSSGTILTLLGNLDRLKTKYDAIGTGVSKYGDAVKATTETAQFKFNQSLAQLQVTGIQIGSQLIPVLVQVAGVVAEVGAAFGRLSPEQQKWLLITLGSVAALGPLLTVMGNLTIAASALSKGFQLMTGSMTLAEAGAAGVGGAFVILAVAAAGATYAIMHANDSSFDTAHAFDGATAAVTGLTAAFRSQVDTLSAHKNALLGEKSAALAVKDANVALSNYLQGGGRKGSLEYRHLLLNQAQAAQNLADATTRVKQTQQDSVAAAKKYHNEISTIQSKVNKTTAAYKFLLTSMDSFKKNSVQDRQIVADYADKMNHLAGQESSAAKGLAALGDAAGARLASKLAAAARQAALLALALENIPKHLDVYITTHSLHEGGRSAANSAMGQTSFAGGWSWVGERGAELLNLPPGTRIKTHSQSMAMAGGGGSAGGGGRPTQVNLVLDRKVIASVLVDAEQTYRRHNAGRSLFAV